MRSARIQEWNGLKVLRREELPVEESGLGEVHRRIRAIDMHRTEVALRSGRSAIKSSLPSKIDFGIV